jgi:uncharacterized protein (UPF0332 family)
MAVLNPNHLLDQAEILLQARNSLGKVRQVNRRRAISAAYYAVFHFTRIAIADQVVGKAERKTARYVLAYRSVDHGKLEALCKVASNATINRSNKYADFMPEGGFGENIRKFASLLLDLKEKRTSADYDPSHSVKIVDAKKTISAARNAIEQFKNAPESEKLIFLTLLSFPPR